MIEKPYKLMRVLAGHTLIRPKQSEGDIQNENGSAHYKTYNKTCVIIKDWACTYTQCDKGFRLSNIG